jgi:hemerythrin superfamily protein
MAVRQPEDAIQLLKADHRKVKDLFARYESARDFTTKEQIARQVFTELDIHAQLEETIFYPAFAEQADAEGGQLIEAAREDHQTVKNLMAELQSLDVEGEEFEAKFQELMQNVQDHVEEEENEMFPEAEEILAEHMGDLMDEMRELKKQLTTS